MRSATSIGYLDETEILQDGQWKNVGKLPRLRTYVRCATLSNTVFVTGNVIKEYTTFNILFVQEGWTLQSFQEQTSLPIILTLKIGLRLLI